VVKVPTESFKPHSLKFCT